MSNRIALFLCSKTTNMAEPWLAAGYECWLVDIQHPAGEHHDGRLVRVGADLRTWLPPRRDYVFAFAFPPCTNQSVSGARWFREKGLAGLAAGIELVERSALICQWTEAPWGLEHPVSVVSSYWRKPDFTFHPWEYAGWLPEPEAENYTKKTCLWTGGGFVMPEPNPAAAPHRNDIWRMPPSDDRGDLRSVTPRGFARAVWAANDPRATLGAIVFGGAA
jgi:hypothetical protein